MTKNAISWRSRMGLAWALAASAGCASGSATAPATAPAAGPASGGSMTVGGQTGGGGGSVGAMPPTTAGGGGVGSNVPTTDGLGGRPEVAIEVCRVRGAEDYLGQQRCPDGAPARFTRRGNIGPRNDPPDDLPQVAWEKAKDPTQQLAKGEVDYHVVDLFMLKCGDKERPVFVDVYHCR